MDKLVSVLSPCYNHERHIDEYVGGLLAQSYRNLEIIIIDDCSTDASWEVLKSHEDALRSAFPRVILERNAANLGLLGTMERMARMVTGEYLCTVDTDDFFYPEHVKKGLERQYNETLVRLATLDRDRETFKKGMKELARKRLVSRRCSAYIIEWLSAANPIFHILRPAIATFRRRGIIAKQA